MTKKKYTKKATHKVAWNMENEEWAIYPIHFPVLVLQVVFKGTYKECQDYINNLNK